MFSFSTHPSAITVGGGVESAFEYLQRTWQKWLPVAGVAALVAFVLYLIIGQNDPRTWTTIDASGHLHVTASAGTMARYYLVMFLSGIVTMIASWTFYAVAICGLRNRPLEANWVILRGVLAFVASLLIGLIFVVAALVAFIVIFIVAAIFGIIAWPIGILLAVGLITAAIVGAVYAGIRIIFTMVAIFDGFNPVEAIQESWRLSQGSVLRIFGWGLMAILIALGFGIIASLGSTPFTIAGLTPFSQATSTLISLVGTCFVAYLLSVLYESERARKYPNIYGYAPVPGYPPYAGPGQYPGAPAGYPSPYPGAPGQYPGDPSQYPGAPSGSPAPYPGSYPGYPTEPAPARDWSNPPAYANGAPIWGADARPQTPLPAPNTTQVQSPPPTDPPASS